MERYKVKTIKRHSRNKKSGIGRINNTEDKIKSKLKSNQSVLVEFTKPLAHEIGHKHDILVKIGRAFNVKSSTNKINKSRIEELIRELAEDLNSSRQSEYIMIWLCKVKKILNDTEETEITFGQLVIEYKRLAGITGNTEEFISSIMKKVTK